MGAVTAIKQAFAEYLPEISMCECDTCRRKSDASQRYYRFGTGSHAELVEMWSAISDLLRELVEGRHTYVSIAERCRQAQEANVAAGRPARGTWRMPPSIARQYGATGMGLGIGGRI